MGQFFNAPRCALNEQRADQQNLNSSTRLPRLTPNTRLTDESIRMGIGGVSSTGCQRFAI